MTKPLRMNQGDRTEGRVYFLPHFVARRLGLFEREGVDIAFVWAEHGEHLAKSGQIPAVLNGEADFTVGGPMVTMRMQAEGTARLVNFCALVQRNPWFLAARRPVPDFRWDRLAGKTVLDAAGITTATLSLRWLLARNAIEPAVRLVEPKGGEAAGLESFLAGEGDYLFHSLHALGPLVADGRLSLARSLAADNGKVPWSAYIALPETLAEREADFAAFARAMGKAMAWVSRSSAEEIVDLVVDDYPGYPRGGLIAAVGGYKAIDVWAHAPLIPEADFANFRGMLMDVGWFETAVPYIDQVATGFMSPRTPDQSDESRTSSMSNPTGLHSLDNAELLKYYTDRGWGGRIGFGERPALLVVDLARAWMQGEKIGSDLSAVVEATKVLLASARAAGIPVFFSTMAFEPDLSDAGGIINRKLLHFDDMIRGTDAVELLPDLERRPGEVFFVKQRPSCFYGTNLLSQLIGRSVDTLIVTGCSTSGCIRATCESSIDNNMRTIVPREAVGDRCASAHAANLFDINARYADVLPLAEVKAYLDGIAASKRAEAA